VKGDIWRVEEHRSDGSTKLCEFARRDDEPLEDFLRMLCANYGAGVIHLHNISGSREPLQDAMPRLGIPYGYTVHDLNFACPTVTLTRADGYFCGGVTDAAACAACLAEQHLGAVDIARCGPPRRAPRRASFVIAPSRFAADCCGATFRRPTRWSSRTGFRHASRAAAALAGGADAGRRLRRSRWSVRSARQGVATDRAAGRARRVHRARVRFVVVGYTDHHHRVWQSDDAR